MSSWVKLGSPDGLASEMRLFQVGRKKIAVAKLEGEIFAFDGLCPHAFGPMHRAEVDGAVVTCPYHAWRFDLKQQGRELHGYRPLGMYPVKLEGNEVHVLVDDAAQAVAVESRPCKLSFQPA